MSDPAAVLISTAALLAVAVMAGAVGSLRADVRELRSGLDALRGERARDASELRKQRAAVVTVRLAVRRLRRLWGAPLPPEEPPEPDPIGFRR